MISLQFGIFRHQLEFPSTFCAVLHRAKTSKSPRPYSSTSHPYRTQHWQNWKPEWFSGILGFSNPQEPGRYANDEFLTEPRDGRTRPRHRRMRLFASLLRSLESLFSAAMGS